MNREKLFNLKNVIHLKRRDLCWIIFILIMIIAVLSSCLINGYDIGSLLSTVSTVVSILLSIVAMFYSIVTNSDSQRINTATEVEIARISQKIDRIDEKIGILEKLDKIADQNYRTIKNAHNALEIVSKEIPDDKQEVFDEMKDSMGLFLQSYEQQLENIKGDK